MGARLSDDLRAIKIDSALVFDRSFDQFVPQTEVRRLQFYAKWIAAASPGSTSGAADFGLNGAVPSDTFSLDPDLNFDRLLMKIRVPASGANEGDTVKLAVLDNSEIVKSIDLTLIQDPQDDDYLITESPVLLYDDPDSELDTAAIAALLPEGAILFDPRTGSTIGAILGDETNPPACDAVAANYVLHSISQLFSHLPATNATAFTSLPSGAISTPGTGANFRLAYKTNAADTTPDVRISAVDPTANLPVPLEVCWFVNVKFKAGDTETTVGRTFNIPAQWHVMSADLAADLAFNIQDHLNAWELDQLVDAVGPADYEIFAQVIHTLAGNQKLILESNLVPFKIVGVNPAKAPIAALIDGFTIAAGGPVTAAIAARLLPQMIKWYKSIAAKESAKGPYTGRQNWDHFERNSETAGIDIGFARSIVTKDKNGNITASYHWNARYGWPFVSYDNGWGIAQLTNPTPDVAYRNISRWKNNVYRGWLEFTGPKLRAAIGHLINVAGRQLTVVDDFYVIREAVKKYNSGREYIFDNGTFVDRPTGPNTTYLGEVETAGKGEGFLP